MQNLTPPCKTILMNYLALSEDMYDDGFHNIVNIDFSKTVIENMTEKCKDRAGMECKHWEFMLDEP